MSNAIINKNFALAVDKLGSGNETPTFTDIPGIVDVSGPGASVDDVETTVWSSVGKEFRAGMVDSGEATVEFLLDPEDTTHQFVIAAPQTGTIHDFKLAVGTLGHFAFTGYFKSFEPSFGKRGDVLTSSFGIRVTGVTTFVPAGD